MTNPNFPKTSAPILQFYDPDRQIKITTDASEKGLGTVLQQKHEDKWLHLTTPAEQNYCPIELEMLSIVYACNKFHQFIYGRHFLVENDHNH